MDAARRSWRMVRRRKRASQASVSSTTQRCRPSRSERSTPRRTPGTTSSTAASILLSWRLAPLGSKPSGVPRAQAARCRFMPGRPRSVGFGPIFVAGDERPLLRGSRRCRSRPGSGRAPRPRPAAPGAPGAERRARRSDPPSDRWRAGPHHASRAGGASRACPGPRSGVMPVQPNASRGNRSQPTPDRSTNTMPSSARRSQHSRAPALRLRRLLGQKRRHRRPQLVAHNRPGHGPQRHTPRWVLLGALSSTLAIRAARAGEWVSERG